MTSKRNITHNNNNNTRPPIYMNRQTNTHTNHITNNDININDEFGKKTKQNKTQQHNIMHNHDQNTPKHNITKHTCVVSLWKTKQNNNNNTYRGNANRGNPQKR